MSENIVEIRDLTRRFWRKTALTDITLNIPRGIVFGLVGENGAGKTTLIKHLLGLLKAQAGTVSVFGLNPVDDPVRVLGRIGYLSESREMPDWMQISQFMSYSQAFYPKWDVKYAEELREMFELARDQRIKSLSRGQRARVGLLAALAHRPDFLVLDEPSSGLDPIVRRDILSAIIRTVADEGRTILFSSHLLDEVERVADHVAMLHLGRLVISAPLDQILEAHHLLTLQFPESLTSNPTLPGGLGWSGEGREWTCVCNGELEQLRSAATSVGASIVEQRRPSLEDVFLARARSVQSPSGRTPS
ncbi:MAG: ABC transporter ATP-binding protein [Planctomycetaceae bacterium]|nr:ABC transporter ATP-binding protein [Planctomycetales bacterium]MCB9939792.1 ABC transporter ATP-binding protein [Planctomycetaceae bacterium]